MGSVLERARVLIDTGPIVAVLSDADQHHGACLEQLRGLRTPLLTCWPVITEVTWLLRRYPLAIEKFLSSFAGRLFQLAYMEESDLEEVSAILAKYKTLGIQPADASLVHLANREGIDTVFTLDQRDFSVLRLASGKKFRVIP